MRPWKILLIVTIVSVGLGLFSSYHMYGHRVESCELCGISINSTFEARLHLKDGTVKLYCCIHDALHAYRELKERVDWVSVTDQETGEKLSAADALFVENDVVTCKPCGLKVHVFAAEFYGIQSRSGKYMKVFGGRIVDDPFSKAREGPKEAGKAGR